MTPGLSKKLNAQFAYFLDTHPPEQFSASIRRMLLEYMAREMDSGFEREFSRFLISLSDFFDLLDEAAMEQQKQTITSPAVKNRKPKS